LPAWPLQTGVFPVVVVFVVLVLATVILLVKYPHRVLHVANYLERRHMRRLVRLLEICARGFALTMVWLSPWIGSSFLRPCCRLGLTAYVSVLLLDHLALGVPVLLAFSLYPVAMLPGGIGSTEAVLVILLSDLGSVWLTGMN